MESTKDNQKQVLIAIACGSCELETVMLATTLQMFGAVVVLASVDEGNRTCQMVGGFMMTADISINHALRYDWDLVVIPGGGTKCNIASKKTTSYGSISFLFLCFAFAFLTSEKGALIMRNSKELIQILERQKAWGKLYAASGAAPARVLADAGLGPPISTCFPKAVLRACLENPKEDDVVIYNNVVTAQGVGSSSFFAIELGELLFEDTSKANLISRKRLFDRTGKLGYRRLLVKHDKQEIPYDGQDDPSICDGAQEVDTLIHRNSVTWGPEVAISHQSSLSFVESAKAQTTNWDAPSYSQFLREKQLTEKMLPIKSIYKPGNLDFATLREAKDCKVHFRYISSGNGTPPPNLPPFPHFFGAGIPGLEEGCLYDAERLWQMGAHLSLYSVNADKWVGADSILLVDEVDEDLFATFQFTTPANEAGLALCKSQRDKHIIRVFRGSEYQNPYKAVAPGSVYRYDGLYCVSHVTKYCNNGSGEFLFERVPVCDTSPFRNRFSASSFLQRFEDRTVFNQKNRTLLDTLQVMLDGGEIDSDILDFYYSKATNHTFLEHFGTGTKP